MGRAMLRQLDLFGTRRDVLAGASSSGLDDLQLLTAEELAHRLRVKRSWVYEHTRRRGPAAGERLPFVRVGKYVRFDPDAVREFLRRSMPSRLR